MRKIVAASLILASALVLGACGETVNIGENGVAQGITVQTASRRASEAIQRTREKYLESFLADGKSPQQVFISDASKQSPYLCAQTHAAAKNLSSTG